MDQKEGRYPATAVKQEKVTYGEAGDYSQPFTGDNDDEEDRKLGKMKGLSAGSGKSYTTKMGAVRCCQVEKCGLDLAEAKLYHRKHKVCEVHAKAQVVLVDGIRQRFCQQCSRFHELTEFDESKRSCRRRLAGHNERRRKIPPAEESSLSGSKGATNIVCRQVDDRRGGRISISCSSPPPEKKHFQIR